MIGSRGTQGAIRSLLRFEVIIIWSLSSNIQQRVYKYPPLYSISWDGEKGEEGDDAGRHKLFHSRLHSEDGTCHLLLIQGSDRSVSKLSRTDESHKQLDIVDASLSKDSPFAANLLVNAGKQNLRGLIIPPYALLHGLRKF